MLTPSGYGALKRGRRQARDRRRDQALRGQRSPHFRNDDAVPGPGDPLTATDVSFNGRPRDEHLSLRWSAIASMPKSLSKCGGTTTKSVRIRVWALARHSNSRRAHHQRMTEGARRRCRLTLTRRTARRTDNGNRRHFPIVAGPKQLVTSQPYLTDYPQAAAIDFTLGCSACRTDVCIVRVLSSLTVFLLIVGKSSAGVYGP